MSPPPAELIVLAVLLLINRLVVPTQALNTPVYGAIQLANGAAGVYALFVGVPGLDRYPVVGWMVGGLLLFHVAQNASIRSRKRHDLEMREADRERMRERAALRRTGEPDEEG
jgi:hypothetical protein